MSTLLFVYGTLKAGCSNHRHLADQKFVGTARTVPGYTLYELGGYPAIAPHVGDREGVAGEVWAVSDEALRWLDEFEGVHEGLYRREPIPLQTPFAEQRIDAYVSTRPITGRPQVGNEWIE